MSPVTATPLVLADVSSLKVYELFRDAASFLFPAGPPESMGQEVLILLTDLPGLGDMPGYVQEGDQGILLLAIHASSWAGKRFQMGFYNLVSISVLVLESCLTHTLLAQTLTGMGWLPIKRCIKFAKRRCYNIAFERTVRLQPLLYSEHCFLHLLEGNMVGS